MSSELDPRLVRRLADMCAVYRMYDSCGRLLYIGKTARGSTRFGEHSKVRWFPLVKTIEFEWFDTAAQATVAETQAIKTEQPRYNIAGRRPGQLARRRKHLPDVLPDAPKRPAADVPGEAELLAHAVTTAAASTACARLLDLLNVFNGAPGLHWTEAARRLAAQSPEWWAETSAEALSAQCRSHGVPSVNVKVRGVVRRGCRRADVVSSLQTAAATSAAPTWGRV